MPISLPPSFDPRDEHRGLRHTLLFVAALALGCGKSDNANSTEADTGTPINPSPAPEGDDSASSASSNDVGTSDGSLALDVGNSVLDAIVSTPDTSTSPTPDTSTSLGLPDSTAPDEASSSPPTEAGAITSPCPPQGAPCIFLPVGDSITEGFRSSDHGGYRSEMFHLALADKKSITYVGTATPNGPTTVDGVTFPRDNDGYGGYRIDQIQALIVASMKANKSDIVTLMIGTNDINQNDDLTNAPSRLGTLMDTILAQDSHLVLFVATVIPTTDDTLNARLVPYNNAIPGLVKTRADAGKHVVLVDLYTPFVNTPNYKTTLMQGTKDILHPAEAGYQKMGTLWYAAVKPLLP